MALKQADQIRYDSLVTLITTLKNLEHDYHTILGAAASQIKDFEKETGLGVRVKSNFEVELIDRRKDFMRIRSPNTESKVLRTKIDGVAIDVKIFKEGDYEFDNSAIETALRLLADEVSDIGRPLVEFPDCEVKEHIKELSDLDEDKTEKEEVDQPQETDSSDGLESSTHDNNGIGATSGDLSSSPASYVSTDDSSEVARFDSEEVGNTKKGEFQFEASEDFDNSSMESEVDELYGN